MGAQREDVLAEPRPMRPVGGDVVLARLEPGVFVGELRFGPQQTGVFLFDGFLGHVDLS